MASGKLSTRQKMINMMYLVLTAMLALSVSTEILQAFESLRSSLATSADNQGTQNFGLAGAIVEGIKQQEASGTDRNSYLKAVVKDITEQTNVMVTYLDEITVQLEEFAQKDAETGELERKDELDENYRYWLGLDDLSNGGRGNGEAVQLREKLDRFVVWANQLYAKYDTSGMDAPFKPMVVEPKDDASITKPEEKSKTWEYHTFHGKPVIADMAMVEKMKMDVREIETGLLALCKNLAQTSTFTVDSLIAFEAPSAQVVAAGMKFSTVLGVGVASKNIKPEFMGNGIQINPGGSTATMTLTANGSVIPQGQYEGIQHYTAMIKVPTANGDIEEIPVKGQFRVRKPEVVVRMKELQILYKDCGNTVVVDVPALGDQYNPDFSKSTGGKVIPNARDRKEITVVPSAQKFDLEIASNTNGQVVKLDKLTYKVVQPPKPQILIKDIRGNLIGPSTPIDRRQPVTVQIKPDPEFLTMLPRDARYTATKVKVLYKPGITTASTAFEVSGASIQSGIKLNLNQGELKNAQQGDKIFFEIEGLRRTTFEGRQVEVAGMSVYDLTIPAILK